jgi:hypothetical protein
MNGRTIFLFIVSIVVSSLSSVALYNLLLLLFNSIFPAVAKDTFNREVHVMPVSNMLWSFVLCAAAGVLVVTFVFKKLKKTYSNKTSPADERRNRF